MTLSVHRGLELIVGMAILAVPLIVSATTTAVGGAGLVMCVTLGAILVGVALGADDVGGIGPGLHASVDRALVAAQLIAAIVLVLVGEAFAAACCLAGGLAELALLARTRYVIRPGPTPRGRGAARAGHPRA